MMVPMFVLFSIAVPFNKNCLFCSYKHILIKAYHISMRFTQVTFQQTSAHLLVIFNT